MRRSLDRMNWLVGELLFLARKSEDAYTEELPMKIFLQDLIAEQYQPIADDKWVTLKLSVKKDFAFNTRAVYLEKVIWNLIKNAIFYTPTGWKVEIIVSPKEIIVKDNGIGMSQEDLMHIWDRFYRVDRARSQEQKWWYGLWLAIVRKIADEQKWKVWVRSELWKWAEFTVRF
jgi:signal transduction histidine kinase